MSTIYKTAENNEESDKANILTVWSICILLERNTVASPTSSSKVTIRAFLNFNWIAQYWHPTQKYRHNLLLQATYIFIHPQHTLCLVMKVFNYILFFLLLCYFTDSNFISFNIYFPFLCTFHAPAMLYFSPLMRIMT